MRAALLSVAVVAAAGAEPRSGPWGRPGALARQELRQRLDLYLRALRAAPNDLETLKKQDPADGIWLMERNPTLRARLELVAVLTAEERAALLDGETYLSPAYDRLPLRARELMDGALGTNRRPPAERGALRYQLQVRSEDGVQQLMVNVVDATGRPRSGGSVMPGVRLRKRP